MARLQFRHLDEAFANREDAISYIKHLTDSHHVLSQEFSESLIGEPIVVKYTDENNKAQVILAIGVEGNKGEGKLVDYHIIDSAYLDESISELSGMTEEIRELVNQILEDIDNLEDRVDVVESGLTEIRELIETITSGTVKSIEINMDEQWEGDSGHGTTSIIEDGIAKITLTTDNVRVADGYEGKYVHHDHSVTEAFNAIESALTIEELDRKGIHIIKITDGELPTNVLERYKLVDKDGNPVENSANIDIYKDQTLKDVYLDGQELVFIYILSDGTEKEVRVDISGFIIESEFADGLQVNNQIVSVKVDATSDPYLTVSENGVKVSGIESAINAVSDAVDTLDTKVDNEIDRAQDAEDALDSKIDAEIENRQNADNVINSALTEEIARAQEAETELANNINNTNDRLTAITGQEGNTYKKHNTTPDDNANYINVAESMDNADFILDQKLGQLSAATISEMERVDNSISSVNSTLSSQIQELSQTLSNEIENRQNADNALDARIDTLEGKTISGVDAINVAESGSNTNISLLINEEDKMLSQNALGIKSTVSIDILKENDKDYILLKGINGQEISRVDATAFIKDGMLDSVEWIPNSNILQFTFNTDAGKEVINIDFAQFVNDEVNRQIAILSGAVATINGDVNTANSTYYKIDDVLVKYNVAGSAVDAAHSLIRYYVDAEGHKYYVSSNAKDMYYSGECLETVITNVLSDMTTVKEKTEEMEDAVNEVKESIYEIKDDLHDLSEDLLREVQRATSAETELHNEIETERQRATSAETVLQNNINAEATARENADNALDSKIDSEIERAQSAETIIDNKVDAEAERATNKENEIEGKLLTDVVYDSSAKTIDFYDAENRLIDSIDATDFIKDGMVDNVFVSGSSLVIVFNTDAGKEEILIPLTDIFDPSNYYTKDDIDEKVTIIESAITIERETRESEDELIWSAITDVRTVISANTSDIDDLSAALQAEITRATSAETIIDTKIENEITRAQSAETILQSNIDAEADARESEDEAIWNAISGNSSDIDDLSAALQAEITRATSAETELHNEIETERQRANSAETVLQNNIDAEATARENADNVINSALTEEIIRAQSAETILQNNIDSVAEQLLKDVVYDSSAKTIDFYDADNNLIDSIDATDFIKDGMVDNVVVSGSSLVIVFNTDAGKEAIEIPLTDIFDPANYYTKSDIDTIVVNIESAITIENERATTEEQNIWNAISGNSSDIDDLSAALQAEIERATSAETELQEYIEEVERVAADALNDLNDRVDSNASAITNNTTLINNLSDGLQAEAEARAAEDVLIWSAITGGGGSITDLSERLQAEIERATSAETIIDNKVDNETQRALDEEAAIWSAITGGGGSITDLTNRLEAEIIRATSAETIIDNKVDNEIIRATSAETILQNNIDNVAEQLLKDVVYDSSAKTIDFYDAENRLIDSIDATDFIKDGMVDNVVVSGSNLVITFNTDAGKEEIVIPLTDIFNPANYYTKSDIDTIVVNIESAITIESERAQAEESDLWDAISGNSSDLDDLSERLQAEIERATSAETIIDTKVNVETERAQSAETILQNNIDAEETARESEDALIWSAMTNIREVITDNEFVIAAAFNDLNDRVSDLETIEIPTNVSELNNDANYITSAYTTANYYTKNQVDQIISSINGVFMKVTSAEYEAMYNAGTLDPDILYVIID